MPGCRNWAKNSCLFTASLDLCRWSQPNQKGCCLQSPYVTKGDPQCVLHQICQVGSPGVSVVGQPNCRTRAPQTTGRLLILGHLENFITQDTKIWAVFCTKHSGCSTAAACNLPSFFNWVECKSQSCAEPDTKVISSSITSESLRTNFPSPCLKYNS